MEPLTLQAKIISAVVTAVVIGLLSVMAYSQIKQMRMAAAQNEQRGGVLDAASAGIAEGSRVDRWAETHNAGVTAGRETFRQSKTEAIRNEPETATRADRPVPASVRDAYRARRLARERLGCAEGECGQDRQPHTATKR
jgi:hypothetical protein